MPRRETGLTKDSGFPHQPWSRSRNGGTFPSYCVTAVKTFNWYIAKNMLATLGMALGILAFVMLSAHFFRAFSLLANGVSPLLLLQILGYLLPDVLRYALPLSMLISTVLVFNRMSADDEIIALKASGVGMWQIIAPGLLISVILCAVGLWLGMFLSPEMRYRSQTLNWQAMSNSPLAMLEPGSVVRISDNASVRIGSKSPNGLLHDIHLFESDKDGRTLRDITARQGVVNVNSGEQRLELILKDFTISEVPLTADSEESANVAGSKPAFLSADQITVPIQYGTIQDSKGLKRKLKMMDMKMLLGDLRWTAAQGESPTEHWVEFQTRLALAFSPLAFLLLGIPFGIRQKRSETSSGLVTCILIALFFYAFMLLAESLEKYPAFHPELIIWIPNFIFQAVGIAAIVKLAKH